MKDSKMSDEWIARNWAANPCVLITEGPNAGNVRTGPARLSFPWLLKASKATEDKPDGSFGAVLLFPPRVDITACTDERNRVARENWPEVGKPSGPKLFNPIRDQDLDGRGQPGESLRYAGYEKGSMRIAANSNRAVPVADAKGMTVTDHAVYYPGIWAICLIRCYPFTSKGNKGPTFGLQAVRLIADDNNIGGSGSVNMAEAFAGVNIEAGDINPDVAFGAAGGSTAEDADPFAN